MSGSQTSLNKQKDEIIIATSTPPTGGDFVCDGNDEDDRPLNQNEMLKGIKNKGGRPILSNPKKSTTIRLNAEVLGFFKARGKGWQTMVNDILQKYVDSHS